MRPNFLIIGAPKAGTSSLHAWLRQHPDVGMPEHKEPRFFAIDELYEGNGEGQGWAWYESLFEGMEHLKAVGEASPPYAIRGVFPHAADRINQDLPDAKLIYAIRHPLRRIESHWVESRKSRQGTPGFLKSVRSFPKLLDATRYHSQLQAYLETNPQRPIRVVTLEQIKHDPQAVLRGCFEFLEVDPAFADSVELTAQNVSAKMAADSSLLSWSRRVPLLDRARRLIPKSVRQTLLPSIRKPIETKPIWDRATWAYAKEQLEAEVTGALSYAGLPDDYYDWDDVTFSD